MHKRCTTIVRDLMAHYVANQWQAEQVEGHPHAGLVLEYALARNLTPREAISQGKLWKVIDRTNEDNHTIAWAYLAYEAWQLARPRLVKRPAFHQCRFEVQE